MNTKPFELEGILFWVEYPESMSAQAEENTLKSLAQGLEARKTMVLLEGMKLRWMDPQGRATGTDMGCREDNHQQDIIPILSWSDISEKAQEIIVKEAVKRGTTAMVVVSEAVDVACGIDCHE